MESQYPTLSCIPEGHSGCVRALELQGAIRSRLLDIGLIPGTHVTCVQAGRGIAAYRIRGAVIALRDCDAEGVLIE